MHAERQVDCLMAGRDRRLLVLPLLVLILSCAMFYWGYTNTRPLLNIFHLCPAGNDSGEPGFSRCMPTASAEGASSWPYIVAEIGEGLAIASAILALALSKPRIPLFFVKERRFPRVLMYFALLVAGIATSVYVLYLTVNMLSIIGGPNGIPPLLRNWTSIDIDTIFGGSFSRAAFEAFAIASSMVCVAFLGKGLWPSIRKGVFFGATLLLALEVPLAIVDWKEIDEHIANYSLAQLSVGGSIRTVFTPYLRIVYYTVPYPLISNMTVLVIASFLAFLAAERNAKRLKTSPETAATQSDGSIQSLAKRASPSPA